jgi:hypothetical protein
MQNTRSTSINVNPTTKLTVRLRSRVRHLALFWFVIWPGLAVVLGACKLLEYPTTKNVPWKIALPGVAAGVLYLVPEFLATALILFVASSCVFAVAGQRNLSWRGRIAEPVIAFVAIALGIALEFPAVLNNPVFMPIRSITLLHAYITLLIVVFGLGMITRTNGAPFSPLRAIAPSFLLIACGWMVTQVPVPISGHEVNRNSTVILGIDSLGMNLDIDTMRDFAQKNSGAIYEQAITPGLLTNAVWTAIIEHRPIRDTGTLLTFQTADWSQSPYQLITEAKRHGYQTWSFFTGQNTIYVGSTAGFDHDRSGPMGWLQDATAAAKDGSVFTSFVVSRLPHVPFSRVSANQAGTYAFDLKAAVRSIVTAHEGSKPVFAVSHLGYLHDETYPRFEDLPKEYQQALLASDVGAIRDLSGDWQNPSTPGDNIGLNAWKLQNVQKVVTEEIERSGFLDPNNANHLVLLSDHGFRWQLTNESFAKQGYYHVPLITFGVPVRDLHQPISLLEISSLIGLEDHTSGVAEPTVEYVNFPSLEAFSTAILGAKWSRDGRIDVSPEIARKYLGLLKAYDPTTHVMHRASEPTVSVAKTDAVAAHRPSDPETARSSRNPAR